MLLKVATLRAIVRGEIDLAFRRWKRSTVKAGGRLRTAVGELEIVSVEPTTLKAITERQARRAGFASRSELLAELRGRQGTPYRVELRYRGADTRVALRQNTSIPAGELNSLLAKLERMDRRAEKPWTLRTLRQIARKPGTRAPDLAAEQGLERDLFKRRVRRLKELGLTESLEVGYRLSPRGKAALRTL